ncbi:MAG TPA: acetoacetate--CoA ligase [Pseudonocardiaceae bacterium]|jgi:acetoacetyl-CoA synthetase|nr:acetoacetate--CoA ligase [Pseudonocardiaceae bacterium]
MSTITAFARWCAERGAPVGEDYWSLWRWSVDDLTGFWSAVWDYFGIESGYDQVLADERMPGAHWFTGARVNYVRQVFRAARGDQPAVLDVAETGTRTVLSWAELRGQVAALAATLRGIGVEPGDRVVGYLPNTAEAVVAFLASASIGAVWSSCGQDYAATAVADRFGQLDPVVLITADGYHYGGKPHDRRDAVATLRQLLPGLRATIAYQRVGLPVEDTISWREATSGDAELDPVEVAFDHPLWILFSSGTTGVPKGIVHGHGGVLVEHLKALTLHLDLTPGDTFFWYTSPSWMVWNYQVSGLLTGSTIICYDGAPTPAALWRIAAEHRVTLLGVSPGYLLACAKAGIEPAADHNLSALRTVGSSGSALPAESYHWVSEHVGERVRVVSASGGTDIVSAFAAAAATVPIVPGELSVPCLGVALDAWDEQGRSVRDEVGELVVTKPMPSMPLYFWHDQDGVRYRDAYFSTYPGVWRHGDWITITGRGSIIVHGRSDSTLNRNGVRMGSADIYRVVEQLPEIAEALVIGAEQPDGGYWMPLFVVLREGATLDDALTGKITSVIRSEASPRHVPDDILAVSSIPHTRTGKKLEVPVKRILQGARPDTVADHRAVDAPDALAWFADYHKRRSATDAAQLPDPDHRAVPGDGRARTAGR